MVLRLRTPLAILIGLTSAPAMFDLAALSSEGVPPPAFHAVALRWIVITTALLARGAAAGRG